MSESQVVIVDDSECVAASCRSPVDVPRMSQSTCAVLSSTKAASTARGQANQPRLCIPDGGGNGSSAAWLRPLVAEDFRDLRRTFESFVFRWGLVGRLRSSLDRGCAECLFSPEELMTLRNCLVEFARAKGFHCSTTVPIPPSGVWDPVEADETDPPEELLVHLEPWRSGSEDPALTKQLLQKHIDGGHLFELPGGQAAARSRWGKNLAAGKLGHAAGKKPRLIGDGSASGANARCRKKSAFPGSSAQPRQGLPGRLCVLTFAGLISLLKFAKTSRA